MKKQETLTRKKSRREHKKDEKIVNCQLKFNRMFDLIEQVNSTGVIYI